MPAIVLHAADRQAGRKMRLRRQELGYSQSELGLHMDRLSPMQISKYEAGKERMSVSKLWQASMFLGVSIDYFFRGLHKFPVNDEAAHQRLESLIHAGVLIPELHRVPELSARDRETIGVMIRAFLR